jgi:hypothetical protein
MSAFSYPDLASHPSPGRRRAWLLLPGLVLLGAAVCWWLTEPLEGKLRHASTASPAAVPVATISPTGEFPAWPAVRIEGAAAKELLLSTLLTVRERLGSVAGYTATFHKRERLKGVLGPEQTLLLKLRHDPFAVYLKYLSPTPGKEAVYAAGHHDNKVIAHSGGIARLLVPRLAVPPEHPLALADNRHAITEAGLANLTDRLIGFRRLDLVDPEAVTILDRTTDDQGQERLRSIHTHPHANPERPFARVEVLYDCESRLPVQIESYDWPAADHTGPLLLAERYRYDDLDLGAELSDLDFDPANPSYSFHRY